MTIPVTNSFSTPLSAVSNTYSDAAAQESQPQNISSSADTVTLSVAQQVYQLYDQGQSVSQIADSLSLPVESVDSFLGITTTS